MSYIIISKKNNINLNYNCDNSNCISSNLNKFNYTIDLYRRTDSDKKELLLTLHGIYYDIKYAIKNNIDLKTLFNNENISTLVLDDYGEIKSEYLSSYYNMYYITDIEYHKFDYKYIDFLFNKLIEIIEYKDKLLVGNIIIKPTLNYEVKENPTIYYYKYIEELNKLYNIFIKNNFNEIDNSSYFIYTNE